MRPGLLDADAVVMRHEGRTPRLLVAAAITGVVLTGTVGLAMRTPSTWRNPAPDDVSSLSYRAFDRSFEALSDQYVRSVLGLPMDDTTLAPGVPTQRAKGPMAAPVIHDVKHSFTNDRFDDAYRVTSLPFRAHTDTASATRDRSEPGSCASSGGTAWYRYQPSADVALFADTFGTGRTTSLGVFRGTSIRDLEMVGCDTNVVGNTQIGFRATKGTTYHFQVTSPLGGGPTVFELATVGATTIETVSPRGEKADKATHPLANRPEISTDGRWVVFASPATNLTPNRPACGDPTGDCRTIYLRDRLTSTTQIIATTPRDRGGGLAWQSMSANGRFVGFGFKPNSIPGGFQGAAEAPSDQISVYLYDRLTGRSELVSRNSAGEPARGIPGQSAGIVNGKGSPFIAEGSQAVMLSADGRHVAFTSNGTNMGGRTEQGYAYNVYWRDRVTGVTRLVSVDSQGRPMTKANSFSCAGRNISGDGRYVLFCSTFGTGENNGDHMLLYLWDATTGRTRLVTPLPDGGRTSGNFCPALSFDGTRAAFVSRDPQVTDDTNGSPDVYSYDIASGRVQRVSVNSAGEQTTEARFTATESSSYLSRAVTLSADGRYVAFDSTAPDLLPTWVGGSRPATSVATPLLAVYVHDMVTGATVLASMSATGEPLAGSSAIPYISGDGRWVSFFNSSRWPMDDAAAEGEGDVMVHQLR